MSEFEGFDTPQAAAAAASSEGAKPEEAEKVGADSELSESLPPLMTASDLLPPEPEVPQDFDEETPPDPGFLITRNAYGPGAHSVKFSDGTPVGVWANESGLTGDGVRAELTRLGLDADLIEFFARNRDAGISAGDVIMGNPVVQAFAAEEERGRAEKDATSSAFVAAYRKKMKEKT